MEFASMRSRVVLLLLAGVLASPACALAEMVTFSAAEVPGHHANLPYTIVDQPANSFSSYIFGGNGKVIGSVPPDPLYPAGLDDGTGVANLATATAANPDARSLNLEFDQGSIRSSQLQSAVDDGKHTLGMSANPGGWQNDGFVGNAGGDDLGLTGNFGDLNVPKPGTLALLASSGLGLAVVACGRRRS